MLVKNYMTKEVITIAEDKNMIEARELMRGKGIRRVPVIDDIKRVRGIITLSDIRRASPSEASTLARYEANYLLARLKVRDVMNKNVITVHEGDTVEYAAKLLYKNKINSLPVLNDDARLCGIITDSDVFCAFVNMMGIARTSSRISIDATDKVGVIADIAGMFRDANINIISMATNKRSEEGTELIIRADLSKCGMEIIEQIREAGYDVTDISTYKGED